MTNTKPKSWRDQIKVHPAADKSPMMKPDKLKVVGEDIKKNGLHIPIAIFKEQKHFQPVLLAGRNRLDAMEAVGIIVHVEDYGTDSDPRVKLWMRVPDDEMWWPIKLTEVRGDEGIDPSQYVISENIHRNHLTVAEQRDVIARLLQAHPDKSDRQIAEMAKNEHKKVGRVRADLETRGALPHVEKRTDTKGRSQPARKPAKSKRPDIEDYIAERKARLPEKDADAPASALADLSERVAYAETAAIADGGNGGVTVTLPEQWREELPKGAEYIGVPEGEFAGFLMELGLRAFNRALRLSPRINQTGNVEQPAMPNGIAWWLIEMHSKYPDTFNVGSWEGSCGQLAIDKLYAERGVPIGKFREWQQAERNKRREAKRDTASATATPRVGDELDIPAYLRRT